MRQMHDRVCFEPISKDSMMALEKQRTSESLMFLAGKKDKDKTIKARTTAIDATAVTMEVTLFKEPIQQTAN